MTAFSAHIKWASVVPEPRSTGPRGTCYPLDNEPASTSFKLVETNSDVFRTAVERDMLNEIDEKHIQVKSLTARPMNYNQASQGQEFLHMADAICTILGFNNNYDTNGKYVNEVWIRLGKLTGDDRLLFIYDDVDTEFVKAWRCAKRGEIFEALSTEFEIYERKNETSNFYKQIWAKELHQVIQENVKPSSFSNAIKEFAISTRKNNLNQEKLVFIFENLEKIGAQIEYTSPQAKAVLYELYDAGTASYNHIGDFEKANMCIEKCQEYKRYIGIEKEIRIRNKTAVSLCDSFRFKEAEKLTRASYEFYKNSIQLKQQYFEDMEIADSLEYGIVCSQLGQIYGYMNDDRAVEVFLSGLEQFDTNTADYYITLSYLLHFFISKGDKESYENYAKEYFGGNDDLYEQFKYLVVEGSKGNDALISLKFALFVYVKAVNTFYAKTMSKDVETLLMNIRNGIETFSPEGVDQMNGHPWEIIYKHLAMIAHKKNNFSATKYYSNKMTTCMSGKVPVIDAIVKYGEIELLTLQNQKSQIQSKMKAVMDIVKEINPSITSDNSAEVLEQTITYTYR